MWTCVVYLFCLLVTTTVAQNDDYKKPNIIFIMADDLGFADVGFRNKDIISPNIDDLAKEGILLDQSYVQQTCSPSRAAWLTGRYPFKLGMSNPIGQTQRDCLSLNETLLPEKLKVEGYTTHAIGKWHLGFCDLGCTPTRRGFDTFYGIYGGASDKYNHINGAGGVRGYDFHENEEILDSARGQYCTDLYGQRAVDLIRSHNTSSPMYMWLAFQAVHSPVTVPSEYSDLYPGLSENMADFYGMITILDEYVGKVIAELKSRGMYDNTLLVFTTDNGGDIDFGASNYPLRGEKNTVFEGGTRGVGIVAGTKLVHSKGYVNGGLMHAIDWLPTIMHFATGRRQRDSSIDGVDQFDMISTNGASKREDMIYKLFPRSSAIRSGEWKLIIGNPGLFQGYSEPVEPPTSRESRSTRWRTASQGQLRDLAERREERQGERLQDRLDRVNTNQANRNGNRRDSTEYRGRNQRVGNRTGDRNHMNRGPTVETTTTVPTEIIQPNLTTMLFNLHDDPLEMTDLADQYPEIVAELVAKLTVASQDYVAQITTTEPGSNPVNFGGSWSPGWCPGGPTRE